MGYLLSKHELQEAIDRGESLSAIGRRVGRDPNTVRYWIEQYGLDHPNSAKYRPQHTVERERLEGLIAQRWSIRRIAQEIGISPTNLRYWMKKYGLSINSYYVRTEAEDGAKKEQEIIKECATHGETRFILEGRGAYRCQRCRMERAYRNKISLRALLVKEAGGKCVNCGYEKYQGALHFHHLNPAEKCFPLGIRDMTQSLAVLRIEAAKCQLLCSNCHVQTHHAIQPQQLNSSAYNVSNHRRRIKQEITAIAGRQCCICSYSGYIGALEFHHVSPHNKLFGLSDGNARSRKRTYQEARKCVLLCSNCHSEVEQKITTIPPLTIRYQRALWDTALDFNSKYE